MSTSAPDASCTSRPLKDSLPLTVLPTSAKQRASRMGTRRAIVLGVVNLLIVAHVIQWLVTGMTLSPVEPSETMYTLDLGKLNAGFIFFCVAILSTFLFGRFICGWGCHIIALQDLCTWLLGKLGIRPRPLRTRLLLLAPTLLALYMFAWTPFKRLALFPLLDAMKMQTPLWLERPGPHPGFSAAFIVKDFWATFPAWYVAIPFLLVCGFACVYFLGSKGFCTYGCPYGGFFAPVDKLSIGRIVVSDACNQCGHCTAACTSNVRVHQEVHDFGKIVDPGCMKCLDCVSVCPNDALSFAFAAPSVITKPRVKAAARSARPPYDLTLAQDALLLLAGIFLFCGYRGMFNQVPLLMAAGLAGLGVYALVKLMEAFRQPSVRLQNLQMKLKGRFTATGLCFIACSLAFLGAGVWGARVNYHLWRGDLIDSSITVPFATVFNARYVPAPTDKAAAQEAISHLTSAGPVSQGGIGWAHRPRTLVRLSWLHAVAGELPQAEANLTQAIEEGEPQAEWIFGLARLYMLQDKPAIEGKRLYERMLEKHPHLHEVRLALAQLELTTSNGQIAADHLLTLLADLEEPPMPQQYVRATELLIDCGMQNKALEAMRRAVETSPNIAIYHAGYATTLFYAGDPKLAVESMRKAVSMEPDNLGWLERLAAIEAESGDADAAAKSRRRLEDLQRRLMPGAK